MKLGVLALAAIVLSGCSIMNGAQNSTATEAYYSPLILSDRAPRSGQATQISDRAPRYSGERYVPVIMP